MSSFLATLLAAGVPSTPCTGLIGCSGGGAVPASNVIVTHLPLAANLMIMIAASLAVLFIVYAGFRMVFALGDESQISEQKNAVMYALGGVLVVILSQLAVSFVGTQNYGQGGDPKDLFINASKAGISILLTIFTGTMVIAIIIGAARMLHAQGKSEEFTKGKTIITYAIGGAIIANLANALVQALAKLFNV